MKIAIALFSAACLLLTAPLVDDGPDLTGIKCIVMGGKPAKAEMSSDYMGGTVYFCCGGCKKKFDKDSDSFAVKANHQLVLTGQYVQTGCPFSGAECNKDTAIKVGGAEVCFCCENCQGKVANAADLEAKADMVFSQVAFEKGFAKKKDVDLSEAKCIVMPKRKVNEKQSVSYKDGKVYFCCKSCVGKFNKDNSKYAALANHQLVATGQYKQIGCPISGGEVDDEQVAEIGGVKVKFCCENCLAKVNAESDDAAKAKLVFGEESFGKGFEAVK